MSNLKPPLRVEKYKFVWWLRDTENDLIAECYNELEARAICEAVNASRDVGRDQRRYQWLRDNFSYDDEVGVWSLSWSSPDPLFAASLDWQMIKDAACAVE